MFESSSFCPSCSDSEGNVQIDTLVFRACVPFTGSSNVDANRIFQATSDVNATLAATIENTSEVGFNVIITRSNGDNLNFSVQPFSSITIIVGGALTIDLYSFGGNYTGTFKEQITYQIET